MVDIKEYMKTKEYYAAGHNACAGCGAAIAARHILKAAGPDTIIANATGCLEVTSTPYPRTSWRVPWIHVAFENAAAVASGIRRALKAKGLNHNVIAIGGDGGTFDIGLQALSGVAERGEKILYICYDNEAYQNTGIQRSGATPKYAATTTSPAGKKVHGKMEFKKNMPFIMAAHNTYVATANIAFIHDFVDKIRKALAKEGTSYIQVFSTCQKGWGIDPSKAVEVAKLGYETNITPIFEIEDGRVKINQKPGSKKPVIEFLKLQKRFKHLTDEEVAEVQKHVDENFAKLEDLELKGVGI